MTCPHFSKPWIALLLVVCGVAPAAGQGARRAELPTVAVFDRLDRNKDGFLDSNELLDRAWLERLDENGDGRVAREEALRILGPVFRNVIPPVSPTAGSASEPVWEGPTVLAGALHGVGRRVPDVRLLLAVEEREARLEDFAGKNGLVVGLFTTSCPISRKLAPEMARLEAHLGGLGLGVAWVNANPDAAAARSLDFARETGLSAPVLHLRNQEWLIDMEAATTTEVFLIDRAGTLVYRGAINDQYGVGYSRESASRHYLREAVEALLEGREPAIAATTAPGCELDLPRVEEPRQTAGEVTYHEHIARIMQTHCASCHREDGIGPFPLDSLESVLENAGMIRRQVERGVMPPWFAAPVDDPHSAFANDRSLPDRERAQLLAWLGSKDRPAGDPALAPLPRRWPEGWEIGKPDMVLTLPKPITVPAEGVMPYQNVIVETGLPEDRWVSAYEIQPTARQVVHHVIVHALAPGEKGRPDAAGGYWAAYVPGNSHRVLPEGFAKRLPAGARLRFQIHYTPVGKAVTDQLRLGIIFAPEPPQREVRVAALANPRLRIPAGAANHVETLSRELPGDYHVMSFMPHMHMRGKAFRYEAQLPDGTQATLLDIPRYDFNWQLGYELGQPRLLPRGTRLTITAVFDNSPENPANPDPSRTVTWGEQTWDEMMIGYIEHLVPASGG
jgi:mono/diheme cytochrome c family protein/thiol-disulfide isomerase/thioredoxin